MSTKITLLKTDITKLKADAIVNAANTELMGGGGVDGAIHRAGGSTISTECTAIRQKKGGCETGEAVITNAGNLLCKKVIHTVGPIYRNGKQNEDDLLKNCYVNSLKLAFDYSLRTIAFPNISTGIYHFPKEQAARIAITSMQNYIVSNPNSFDEIIFVCYDEENFSIYQNLLQ